MDQVACKEVGEGCQDDIKGEGYGRSPSTDDQYLFSRRMYDLTSSS